MSVFFFCDASSILCLNCNLGHLCRVREPITFIAFAFKSSEASGHGMIGEFAALGAAVTWAVAPILYKKALSGVSPVSANIVRCASNAAVLVVILVVSGLAGVLARLPLVGCGCRRCERLDRVGRGRHLVHVWAEIYWCGACGAVGGVVSSVQSAVGYVASGAAGDGFGGDWHGCDSAWESGC